MALAQISKMIVFFMKFLIFYTASMTQSYTRRMREIEAENGLFA
jgi:hypothetical protein